MSAEAPTAESVLEYLIKTIVEQPDEVRIQASGDERCTFSVTVADGDMGRVIGRRGRVANAQTPTAETTVHRISAQRTSPSSQRPGASRTAVHGR